MIELQTQFEMQAKMLDDQAKMIAEIKRSQAQSPIAESGAKESPEAQVSGAPEVFAIDTRESLIGESLTMTAPPSASWHEQSDPQLTMERLAAQDVTPLPVVAFHGGRGRNPDHTSESESEAGSKASIDIFTRPDVSSSPLHPELGGAQQPFEKMAGLSSASDLQRGALCAVGKSTEKAEKKEKKAKKPEKIDKKADAQPEADDSQITPAETAPHPAEASPCGLDDGKGIEQPIEEDWPFDQTQQVEDPAAASPEIEATQDEDMQGEEAWHGQPPEEMAEADIDPATMRAIETAVKANMPSSLKLDVGGHLHISHEYVNDGEHADHYEEEDGAWLALVGEAEDDKVVEEDEEAEDDKVVEEDEEAEDDEVVEEEDDEDDD